MDWPCAAPSGYCAQATARARLSLRVDNGHALLLRLVLLALLRDGSLRAHSHMGCVSAGLDSDCCRRAVPSHLLHVAGSCNSALGRALSLSRSLSLGYARMGTAR